MSRGIGVLHSHSGIEREEKFPKHYVLVDEEYEHMFSKKQPYMYKNKMFMKVDILEFVENGGIFKNFDQ